MQMPDGPQCFQAMLPIRDGFGLTLSSICQRGGRTAFPGDSAPGSLRDHLPNRASDACAGLDPSEYRAFGGLSKSKGQGFYAWK